VSANPAAKKSEEHPRTRIDGVNMTDTETFTQLMARLRAGENAAARAVFEQLATRLVALTRRRFNRLLARKVDPEDVVQSVFKSFFARHRAGKLDVSDRDGLWNLLTLITLRKCADRAAYFLAERRDAARETSGPATAHGRNSWWEAADRQPRPDEALILKETVEHLFRNLDVHERPILELSLHGYTAAEISAQLGRAERSVRRLRERIRKKLERLQLEN
jgi:RNA polymerase sigma-70 factor (ECF subfamily)